MMNESANEYYIRKIQQMSQMEVKSNSRSVLHEASFLLQLQGHMGIPFMYWSGSDRMRYLSFVSTWVGLYSNVYLNAVEDFP
jgi:hypothetical protein